MKDLLKTWAAEIEKHLSDKCPINNMKICSISLAIRKMQTKRKLKFHLTLDRIAISKNSKNNKCGQGWVRG